MCTWKRFCCVEGGRSRRVSEVREHTKTWAYSVTAVSKFQYWLRFLTYGTLCRTLSMQCTVFHHSETRGSRFYDAMSIPKPMFLAFLTVTQKSNFAEKWGYNCGTELGTWKDTFHFKRSKQVSKLSSGDTNSHRKESFVLVQSPKNKGAWTVKEASQGWKKWTCIMECCRYKEAYILKRRAGRQTVHGMHDCLSSASGWSEISSVRLLHHTMSLCFSEGVIRILRLGGGWLIPSLPLDYAAYVWQHCL